MSLFKMPKAMINSLDRIRRAILWEGYGDKRKLHLMKWSEVIKPKAYEALGFGNSENKNWVVLANGCGGLGRKRRLFGEC